MTSTSPQNATVSGDAHANEVNDPDEVDISTLPQPLNTKDNNEVDGRTSNDVVSRKAKDIRKQVDYYFSAENLQRDNFLYKKINGSKNRPVPLHVIADFGKMKGYRPLSSIVDALRTSKTINVVEDDGQTFLQRQEPFTRAQLASAAGMKKAKPTAATGFEDWFADAPLTPDAAREEAGLYDIDLPLTERIETAVQRYQTRRKMHSHAKNVFSKWLMYGGIDISPNPFGGGASPEEMANMTTREKKAATAHVYCFATAYDNNDNPLYEVDFVGVTKSYLSRVFPATIDLEDEARIREATNVIENFYRYLNYHNVCPEHTADINLARRVCVTAEHELTDTHRLQRLLPGPFNTACSRLFGGAQQQLYGGEQAWQKANQNNGGGTFDPGQSDTKARQTFMTGMVSLDLDIASKLSPSGNSRITQEEEVVKVESDVGMEVMSILPPSDETVAFYEELGADLSPIGKIVCKPWVSPGFGDWDLPPGVSPEMPTSETYTIYLERDMLNLCFKGMKLEGNVHTLACGLQWLDAVIGVRCSFYTAMENELVKGWKEPRYWTRDEWLQRSAKLAETGQADDEDDDGAGAKVQ